VAWKGEGEERGGRWGGVAEFTVFMFAESRAYSSSSSCSVAVSSGGGARSGFGAGAADSIAEGDVSSAAAVAGTRS